MLSIWIYVLASVLIISLISLIGVFTLSIRKNVLRIFLIYLVAFSAGALFGGAFLHLLPELVEEELFNINTSLLILGGIVLFFALEKIIFWQHCHMPITENHVHSFAYMNLIGDGFHNFIDGAIIAASYLVNPSVGISVTIAVAMHEIPQEIGDFGVLIHGGFSRTKALFMNFLSASIAVVGAVVTLLVSGVVEKIELFLVPIAIGGFIYIAGSDLIPELHSERDTKKAILQIVALTLGVGVMALLLLFE